MKMIKKEKYAIKNKFQFSLLGAQRPTSNPNPNLNPNPNRAETAAPPQKHNNAGAYADGEASSRV
jgi:hypothetical protein